MCVFFLVFFEECNRNRVSSQFRSLLYESSPETAAAHGRRNLLHPANLFSLRRTNRN